MAESDDMPGNVGSTQTFASSVSTPLHVHSPVPTPRLCIKCWNIAGNLAISLTHPLFLKSLMKYTVNIFQETHLVPGQEDVLTLPDGYRVFSIAQQPSSAFRRQWGGVIAIVTNDVRVSLRPELSGPDVMVLDFGDFTLINVYLLPDASPWTSWTSVHLLERLVESLTILQEAGTPVLVMGDFNARVGALTAHDDHPRMSVDPVVTSRGQELLRIAKQFDLLILNGMSPFASTTSSWTSFQGASGNTRRTVVDFCLCATMLLLQVSTFCIGGHNNWSDHAPLHVTLGLPLSGRRLL
jgi:exonuclease III